MHHPSIDASISAMHRLHFRSHFGSSCFGVFVVIVSSAGRFLPSTLCHGLERVCCLRHCVTGIRFRNKNMSAHCELHLTVAAKKSRVPSMSGVSFLFASLAECRVEMPSVQQYTSSNKCTLWLHSCGTRTVCNAGANRYFLRPGWYLGVGYIG